MAVHSFDLRSLSLLLGDGCLASSVPALLRSPHVSLEFFADHEGMADDDDLRAPDAHDNWNLEVVVLLAESLHLGALNWVQVGEDDAYWACHFAEHLPGFACLEALLIDGFVPSLQSLDFLLSCFRRLTAHLLQRA